MECAIGDNARPEAGNGSAGTNTDAAGALSGAAIGHGGSAEHGEFLSRAKGLRPGIDWENCEGCKGGEKSQDKPEIG